ncbi:MAG: signal peptidase I [Lachnospiraceae bacterium]|jgi:signal peptidase I|nr:signal peptidase I [Lachnospiraceae bacterium]
MKKFLREVLVTSIYILVALIASSLIIRYVGSRIEVEGISMTDTLADGESLIVDKISYRFSDPKRYDIVVFPPFEDDKDTNYIKRVIGLPGETVMIDFDGNIYIDGEVLEESYGREIIRSPGRAAEPVVLGADEYFVMGDNRNNSRDSRDPSIGSIGRDQLVGRAFVRVWPFDRFGMIEHQ